MPSQPVRGSLNTQEQPGEVRTVSRFPTKGRGSVGIFAIRIRASVLAHIDIQRIHTNSAVNSEIANKPGITGVNRGLKKNGTLELYARNMDK